MPEAYFVKVNKDSTLDDIYEAVQYQISNSRKMLKYNPIVELSLDESSFNDLISTLYRPHSSYARWASQSIPDKNGFWNCIIVKCASDIRNIVIYTSGRTFPLYISIAPEGTVEAFKYYI